MGNRIYEADFDGNEGKLNYLKKIELVFTSEYLYAIENFPWSEAMKNIFDKQNEIPDCDLDALSEKVTAEKLSPIIDNLKNNLYKFDSEHWSFTFAAYIKDTIKYNISTEEDILCNEEYIDGFKNWCFPCDSGINYFNGEKGCYIHLDNKFDIKYKNEHDGCLLISYRNQIHYYILRYYCDITYLIRLYDIHKSDQQNTIDNLIIPIYDLNLYNANIDCILGISAVVKDIIQKQTGIYTKYLTFND